MPITISPVEVLDREQIELIHATALRVLDEVGVALPHPEVLDIYDAAGARIDGRSGCVRMPPDLVESAMRHCPPAFAWPGRRASAELQVGSATTHFSAPVGTIKVIDLAGRRRAGTAEDGADICRLCDALPELTVAAAGVQPPTMPAEALNAWHTLTCYVQSGKPVTGVCHNAATAATTIRMAEVVAEACGLPAGQLPLAAGINPASPLFGTPDQLAGMLVYLRRGVPFYSITPTVQAGSTGPATLAGVLVQQTAEFLAYAVLAQLVNPGVPVVYGTASSIFDMRALMLPYGAPEADLLAIATVQLARFYGIPSRVTGGTTDAPATGTQAGVECLMSTLLPILAGASLVLHGAGELENSLTVSYEKIVLDVEIIRMARRVAYGIEVTPATLGFDAIREVGPRGHFLDHAHTVQHFRAEQCMPRLLVRDRYDVWQAAGGKHAEERARDLARELLATHRPEPLPDAALRELQAIYAATVGRDQIMILPHPLPPPHAVDRAQGVR